MEAVHIAAKAASASDVSEEDRSYLASLVAARTGITLDDAQKRVDAFVAHVKEVAARAKAAADEARKAAAQAAIYTALAMLMGAFIASVAAAIGGRLRDEHL
jgi:Flp pilus assembly protein TadB